MKTHGGIGHGKRSDESGSARRGDAGSPSQTANRERSLIQELRDALKRFDQDMLRNVRNVAFEHEARRAGILNELQALAASIGAFLPARERVEPVAISQENGHPPPPLSATGAKRQRT